LELWSSIQRPSHPQKTHGVIQRYNDVTNKYNIGILIVAYNANNS